MEGFLKQSTAFTFQLGPFLDDTDGKTPETGLTIAAASILLSKAGGAFAAKNESTALTGTGDSHGYYDCILNTTDTNTLGPLKVETVISGALPVWTTFHVLPAHAYDSLMATAGTDYLPVDAVQIEGADATDTITAAVPTVAAIRAAMEENGASILDTLRDDLAEGGRLDLLIDGIKAVTDAIPDAGAFTTMQGNVTDILADTNELQGDTHTAAEVWDATSSALSLSFEVMLDRIYQFLQNKMTITDATGAVALRNLADSADLATQTITDDDTTTTRTVLTWA